MTSRLPPSALAIAGSDSSGGAGIQADLQTFASHGVVAASAITALTVQSTQGLHAVQAVPPWIVRAQIECALADVRPRAIKIGMLHDARTVRVVAATLRAAGARRIVLDPVLRATSGGRLLTVSALDVLRRELLPQVLVVTPNLDEAAALVGFPVGDRASRVAAAMALAELGPAAVVIKGGHLQGPSAEDLILVRGSIRILRARRLPGRSPHGTGCVFSAAIAAGLACGETIEAAIRAAKRYTLSCLRRAVRVGRGAPTLVHSPRRRRRSSRGRPRSSR